MSDRLPKHGALPEAYKIPDVLLPRLAIVFCGTALGRRSAQDRAYYAHPNNLFWRTLHAVGLTRTLIAPPDYAQLLDHGMGLTDLAKGHFGNDADLPGDAFDRAGLDAKIRHFQPKILAFTSKKAASGYLGRPTGKIALGLQDERIDATQMFVLSSPSGAARGRWDQSLWQDLADLVAAQR